MARLIWTEPALSDLEAVADYIALDNPAAARRLVERVFGSVERLERFPNSGKRPPELPRSAYREDGMRLLMRFSLENLVIGD